MEVAVIATTITTMAAAAVAIEKSEEITVTIARVVGMNEIEEAVIAIETEAVIDGLRRRIQDPAKTETQSPTVAAVAAVENTDVILPNLREMKLCR